MTFFAFLLPVFLLMLSFVFDIGKAFVLKSELNKACLIAAEEASKRIDIEIAKESGRHVLRNDYAVTIHDFFYKNHGPKGISSIQSLSYHVADGLDGPRYIEVRCQARSDCMFLRIFGIDHIMVHGSGIGRLRKIK